MKPPGADVLTDAIRLALGTVNESELGLVTAMSAAEVAQALVASYDAEFMRRGGHRATPEFLRSFACEAEQQAIEFRRIATKREQEAS